MKDTSLQIENPNQDDAEQAPLQHLRRWKLAI
jgi:hypothetical protein